MCGVNCICSSVGVVGCDVMEGFVVLDDCCEADVFKCGYVTLHTSHCITSC